MKITQEWRKIAFVEFQYDALKYERFEGFIRTDATALAFISNGIVVVFIPHVFHFSERSLVFEDEFYEFVFFSTSKPVQFMIFNQFCGQQRILVIVSHFVL